MTYMLYHSIGTINVPIYITVVLMKGIISSITK